MSLSSIKMDEKVYFWRKMLVCLELPIIGFVNQRLLQFFIYLVLAIILRRGSGMTVTIDPAKNYYSLRVFPLSNFGGNQVL